MAIGMVLGFVMVAIISITLTQIWVESRPNQELKSADVVIVLGAAAYYTKPSPVFQARIDHGIKLLEENKAKRIIFTGGSPDVDYPAESTIARLYAEEQGVGEGWIMMEMQSRNTYENMKNAVELMRQKDLESAIIVSDPYHLARAKIYAFELGLYDVQTSPTPTSKIDDPMLQAKFVTREFLNILYFRLHQLIPMLPSSYDPGD